MLGWVGAVSSNAKIPNYDQVAMSYIKWKELTSKFQNSCLRIHSRGSAEVIKCKNPKFLDGKQVGYHMKVLTRRFPFSYFRVPRWGSGHQVLTIQSYDKVGMSYIKIEAE
jgi:hypothetical protein